MHSSILTGALALLTTANAALMMGIDSSGGTYTWLQSEDACEATYLYDICNTDFTVEGGGATFQFIGCNDQVPNMPQYNTRNGNRDANCKAADGEGICQQNSLYTIYAVC